MPSYNPRSARAILVGRGHAADVIDMWLDIHNRPDFAQRYFRAAGGAPWQVRPYQRASLKSRALRKVHCDGRDVGKTTEIEIIAAWALVACPDTEMLIATQCENHLYPLMQRIVRRFGSTPEFAPSLVECRRSPSWHLRFKNGFQIWGRISGPRGMNFQGMHVDWQIVDEAQEMTETAWGELYQSLNGGGFRWVYGVPNGLRNTFYRMTQLADAEQHNWPSALNPEFDDAKDRELALLYGGRTSPGYIHRVLGQHGEPMHAVFHLDDYLACVDPALEFHDLVLREGDDFAAPENIPRGEYYLGCDLGYARDPSEFVVYRDEPPHLVNVLRLHMEGVNYAAQQAAIQELDRAYDFRTIGIDAGNSGRAVAHQLLAHWDRWCPSAQDATAKVQAFEFGGTLPLEPLPSGDTARRRVKEFMTELLQRRMAEGTLAFPNCPDRESQYASHTYAVGPTGTIVYEKGNDHLIDADRCAVLAHYLDTMETPSAPALPPIILGF